MRPVKEAIGHEIASQWFVIVPGFIPDPHL